MISVWKNLLLESVEYFFYNIVSFLNMIFVSMMTILFYETKLDQLFNLEQGIFL